MKRFMNWKAMFFLRVNKIKWNYNSIIIVFSLIKLDVAGYIYRQSSRHTGPDSLNNKLFQIDEHVC